MGQDVVKLLCTYSRKQIAPTSRQCNVQMYDDEWILHATGVVSFEPTKDSMELKQATWGQFLQHIPRQQDRDFYCVHINEEKYYFAAEDPYEDLDQFHGMFRVISRNTEGKIIDEASGNELCDDELTKYLSNQLYFTKIQ